MKTKPAAAAFAALALGLLLAVAACGGGDGAPTAAQQASAVIGAGGGTLTGPNGASLVVPPGALVADTTIAIEQTSAGAAPLPGAFSATGAVFAFTPHGTTFAVPVTLTIPFDPASVPTGVTPVLLKTNAQNQWEEVGGATFGPTSVSATVTSFSFLQVALPLRSSDPLRVWSFSEFRGDNLQEVEVDSDNQVIGTVAEVRELGPALFDSAYLLDDGLLLAPDAKATAHIHSSADGVTFWVGAEAPAGIANLPDSPIGSASTLKQFQTFIKQTPGATLRFTLTTVFLETRDLNGGLRRVCPPARQRGLECDLIKAEVFFEAEAVTAEALPTTTRPTTLFHVAGGATLIGYADNWSSSATTARFSRTPLWEVGDFDFVIEAVDGQADAHVLMKLRRPRTYEVDLSSIAVGKAFTLKIFTNAIAYNRIAGPPSEFATSAGAFLRDPLTIGGAEIATTGLARIDTVVPVLGIEVPQNPAACVPGPAPDPAAGVLQFEAAGFSTSESSSAPVVVVTRSGGSRGAVTATVGTSDGTAVLGVDYQAVNGTVFFADGDTTPRVVAVPLLNDSVGGEPDKSVNLTLSQAGGCAALGAQSTTVLTIRDDDEAPPLPSGLDPGFGSAGKATLERFGGDRSSMALQADGKIVMVGGSFTDFILARFNADGSVDRGFGVDGKVTTDMGSGFRPEEALAVAVQSDGKIVVVGHTAIDARPPAPDLPSTFAIARYNSDGSLDAGFGSGGKVSGGVNGIARAVAVQRDGKIVLAGDFEPSNGISVGDFVVARFNANGSLDLAFGSSGTGQVATDIAGLANRASNIVLQPDGAIVVSGGVDKIISSAPTPEAHTDIVRYSANGALDASFGDGGKLTLPGQRLGAGLALQRDGKLVLVGSVDAGIAPAAPDSVTEFALLRLNADGSADTGFGNAGSARVAIGAGQRDAANAVALQADGRILVAGSSGNINRDFTLARFNTDGTVDSSFGSGSGFLKIDFFRFTDIAESVAVQLDGKIVLGGLAQGIFDGFGVARVMP